MSPSSLPSAAAPPRRPASRACPAWVRRACHPARPRQPGRGRGWPRLHGLPEAPRTPRSARLHGWLRLAAWPGARRRRAGILRSVLGAVAALAGLAAPTPAAWALEVPVYRFTVQVDATAHTLSGELRLELDPADPRLGDVLWFHLPPNRFLAFDTRGRRRNTDSLAFATKFREEEAFDPIWPAGYNPGRIAIERVETDSGVPLAYDFADNPRVPPGYSVRDTLLRVHLGAAPGAHVLLIRFTTTLPQRYRDGWSGAGILAEQWYPILANRPGGSWDFDVFAPCAGRYAAAVTVTQDGQLFLGHGWSFAAQAGTPNLMPLDANPLRVMPLVFMAAQPVEVHHTYDLSLYVYHQPGHERMGRLALQVAADFRRFVRDKYRLPPPDTRIAMIEVDGPPGDIRTVGSLILIPENYFQTSPLLERVFLAQLSRAVAQVWFGEAVWSNRDTQTWLNLGLAGYLALDYFASLYGWNAGIHDLLDWLQPKYREHFFEAPLRDLIRRGEDAPAMISLRSSPLERVAQLIAFNKAPIVLRTLYYVVGPDAFARGLNALYFHHRYQEVTLETLQHEMTDVSGMDLQPFFQEWFYGTPHINFAIEHYDQHTVPGGYEVQVHVRRTPLPELPVDVQVVTASGKSFEQRWGGDAERAVLTFALPEPAATIAIDPEEYWLELDRKDNRSEILYRVRPIFDWPKQRELLVTLKGIIGGNYTDGNYYGLGVSVALDENNEVRVIPIYGQRTGYTNYLLRWSHAEFLLPDLDLTLSAQHLAGANQQGLALGYTLLDTDTHRIQTVLELASTTIGAITIVNPDGTLISQAPGRSNNVQLQMQYARKPGLYFGGGVGLQVVDSRSNYRSDFQYTTYELSGFQTLTLGSSHSFNLRLTGGHTEGGPALHARFPLSGPELLRGYPRTSFLTTEEIATAQLDYGYVLTRRPIGASTQIRRLTLFLFGDEGRGWNVGEHYFARPKRQDVGIGLELQINVLRLAEFPIRMDLAYPVHDEEYHKPQFILLGLLTF